MYYDACKHICCIVAGKEKNVIARENHKYENFTGRSKVLPHHIFCSPASKIGRLLNLY